MTHTPNALEEVEKALAELDALTGRHGTLSYVELGQWVCTHISVIRSTLRAYMAAQAPESAGGGVTYHDTDYSSPLRPERLEYTMCGKIYAVQENGERHMFMDVRGWGYLTGGGAKKLPYEEATVIQDKWANEVVNLWNAATPSNATKQEG